MARITKDMKIEKLISDLKELDIDTLNLAQLSGIVEVINTIKTSASDTVGRVAREIIKEG